MGSYFQSPGIWGFETVRPHRGPHIRTKMFPSYPLPRGPDMRVSVGEVKKMGSSEENVGEVWWGW